MTTLYEVMKSCAVCGAQHEYRVLGSCIAFGSPDLDTRPSEMARSTIGLWVERCPECGYCASDVRTAPDHARSVVGSTIYKKQLNAPGLPALAKSFLCKAIIEEAATDYASAAWSLLYAAWVCDDVNKPTVAKECRSKAADMIVRAIDMGQHIEGQYDKEVSILVDVLRRAGRFQEALQVIKSSRSDIKDSTVARILAFQEMLISRGDDRRHTVAEAIEEKG